jgi:hypothetical protein
MQVDLAVYLVRKQSNLAVIDGGRGLVAGGFDPKHPHLLQFPAAASKIRGPFHRQHRHGVVAGSPA